MKERGIDVVTIGLIFASLPLIFQLTRMVFAIVSDFLGRKVFFILNGVLNVIAGFVYYFAFTPLQFLLGKITEGTMSASLWAVNRAFLLEESARKRETLVHLRTTAYVSAAVGSLLAGFLIVWLFYTNTLLLCIFLGSAIIPISLLLVNRTKERFSVRRAFHHLDIRNKEKIFKRFLLLFFIMGLSFGFKSGYVFPWFLSENGFDAETIGVLLGIQTLLAGLFAYMFTKKIKIEKLVLLSGVLYSLVLLLLGLSSYMVAAFLVVMYGVVDGLLSGGQEGILLKISKKESYGTDIGLLMMGLHGGTTVSLALSGFLIDLSGGFMVPFLLSASIFVFFYVSVYFLLKE
jgi:MFS family permease